MPNSKKQLLQIILIQMLLASCDQKVKETWLIPSGYEGRINVIFNQPKGEPIPVQNGRRIYHIPTDGILITSSQIKDGFVDQDFYYLDVTGKRTKILIQDSNSKEVPEQPMVVYTGANGVYGNSSDTNPLNFTECIIASKASRNEIFSEAGKISFEEKIMKKLGRRF